MGSELHEEKQVDTKRIADNVKSVRAEITCQTIKEFFANLVETVGDDISADRIFNYDETNVTDDPGSKTVIVSRGLRRVERKMEHSKSATSIMFCGAADGTFLPPFVVYKALNLYRNWTLNGPPGAIYDNSKSGWFDQRTFERWFFEIFLPNATLLAGEKVLIGDNLASHFSEEVLRACKEHNIKFLSLLPNATHLLQPLDVSVFGPLKRVWKGILAEWREETRHWRTASKEIFSVASGTPLQWIEEGEYGGRISCNWAIPNRYGRSPEKIPVRRIGSKCIGAIWRQCCPTFTGAHR